jgi:tetratricopeptide (TPR) repeat protein
VLFERGESSEKGIAAFYLGQIAEDRGAPQDAVKYYRQVSFGDQFAPAQIRVANILVKQTDGLSAAREHLQVSAKVYPPAKSQLLVAEAHLLRDVGRNEEALQLLNTVILQQPDQAEALYDAAMLAEKLGRMDVVESNLRRVIHLRPENAHAYNALGYSFADRGIRLDEAYKLIAKASELAPEDPLQKAYVIKKDAEIAAHLGEVLWMLGRQDDAQRIWAEAVMRHPTNGELKAVQQKFLR